MIKRAKRKRTEVIVRLGIVFNEDEVNTKDFREMLRCTLSKYDHLYIKYFAISYESTLEENLNTLYTQYYDAITFNYMSDSDTIIFVGKQFQTPLQYPYKEMVELARAKFSSCAELTQEIVDIVRNVWMYAAHIIPYLSSPEDADKFGYLDR